MRLTTKGQVTIPIAVREAVGLRPGDAVEVVARSGEAVVRRVSDQESRGQRAVRAMKGRGKVEMTTDEILALTRE
jgi:AbrB family looped-hinge helix DNA binding protein